MNIPEQYCMKWNNYQTHIGNFFVNLFETETLVDVTLCVGEHKFHCHRVILSACSSYFQEILANAKSKHPIILLPGLNSEDVKAIIDFIYHGELNNIEYDRFTSILKTAEMLKICGLMEVLDHIPSKAKTNPLEVCKEENKEELEAIDMVESSYSEEQKFSESSNQEQVPETQDVDPLSRPVLVNVPQLEMTLQSESLSNNDQENSVKRRKQRKELPKKYCDGSLMGALSDMKQGMSLVEASRVHKIPRSTLYSKAKQHKLVNLVTRREHSNQDCQAAIQAVAGGMSLQRASEEYGIPKTVLWRRVQKRLDICRSLKERRRVKCPAYKKDAALKALINGEKLVNVSTQYQIPVSTLFKEKARLIESGALGPWEGSKVLKQLRLSQAVEACKQGKMSQATASLTFQIPKTTIWRQLQKEVKENEVKSTTVEEMDTAKCENIPEECPQTNEVILSEDTENTKMDYLETSVFTEAPLIILTSATENDLKLEEDEGDI